MPKLKYGGFESEALNPTPPEDYWSKRQRLATQGADKRRHADTTKSQHACCQGEMDEMRATANCIIALR